MQITAPAPTKTRGATDTIQLILSLLIGMEDTFTRLNIIGMNKQEIVGSESMLFNDIWTYDLVELHNVGASVASQ